MKQNKEGRVLITAHSKWITKPTKIYQNPKPKKTQTKQKRKRKGTEGKTEDRNTEIETTIVTVKLGLARTPLEEDAF